jgi:dolichol-phosphate mannosyltransferase
MSSENPNAEKTLITILTYNEIENLPDLVDAILEIAPDCDILVVDDNSPDGTGRWCDRRAEDEPRLKCRHREGKLGLGTATIAAMQYAIDHGYRYMLNLDADFSHPPKDIPHLRSAMDSRGPEENSADVAIGSRYVSGGGVEGWGWKRKFMSFGVNTYARLLLGLPPKDCSGAFRCFRVAMLEKLDFGAIRSRGYSFQEEVLWHLKQQGARFVEVPFVFVDRTRGSSKINKKEAIAALWHLFVLGAKRLVPGKRPETARAASRS